MPTQAIAHAHAFSLLPPVYLGVHSACTGSGETSSGDISACGCGPSPPSEQEGDHRGRGGSQTEKLDCLAAAILLHEVVQVKTLWFVMGMLGH